ncbi:MAG: tetratricopeptide repeat protein [Candidatus Nitrotoga sp.]
MRDVRIRALLITAALTIVGGGLLIVTQTAEYDTSTPNVLPPKTGSSVLSDITGEPVMSDRALPGQPDQMETVQANKSPPASSQKKTKSATDIEQEKIRQAMAAHAQEKINAEIKQQFQQSVTLLQEKKFNEAITALHRVLQLAPTMPEASANMGYALLGLKRYAAARDFFLASIQLNKNQTNAYYGLAMAHDGLQDLPAAISAMRIYQHLVPADDVYRKRADEILKEWEAQPKVESRTGSK